MIKNRRKKILIIFSSIFAIVLIVACLFCVYASNLFSFIFSLITSVLLIINVLFFLYWLIKRNRYSLVSLISLLCYFIFFSSPVQLNGSHNADDESAFSFMSFNSRAFWSTHNVRNLEMSEKITGFVENKNPDIICFQEFSKFELKSFPSYPHQFVGYRPNFEKSLQVIYSQFPIINKGFVDFPDTRNQTIYADISFKKETIRIYNIHLQSFILLMDEIDFNYKGVKTIINRVDIAQKKQEEQVQIILDHAKKFSGKVIFSGDFNSTQYSNNYRRLKENKEDTFLKSGFGLGITYPLFNYPFRIDFVLVDEGLEVLSHQNFDLKLSDHEPILTRLLVN